MHTHPSQRPSIRLETAGRRAHRAAFSLTAMGVVLATASAHAVDGSWIGTSNALWGDPANWSSTPLVPGASDTATFNGSGSGNTALPVVGSPTIGTIVFDTANAASYNIGSGDILNLSAGGSISLTASVAVPQQIGASVNLGTTGAAEAFTLSNASTVSGATLFVSGTISSGLLTGVKTLTVTGDGDTEVHGSIANGAGSVVVSKTGTGMLSFLPGTVLNFQNLTATAGTTNVNAALGGGAGMAVVTVSNPAGGAATALKFGSVSQNLASLTIGAGATVTFSSGVVGPGGGGGETFSAQKISVVPEPATSGLLIIGALGMLRRRRPAEQPLPF